MSDQPSQFQRHLTHAGPTFRSWLRETFSPGGILAIVRTLLWLVPLTILIWFYAARSIIVLDKSTMPVNIRSSDPSKRVTLVNNGQQLTISFTGGDAKVAALRNRLANLDELPLLLSGTQARGTVYQLTKPLVQESELFRSAGVTVTVVSPDNIGLEIDDIIETTATVRVPDSLRPIIQSATFDPPQVTVRGAATDIAAAQVDGKLSLDADLINLPLLREPGKKDPVLVNVRTPSGMSVRPGSVAATLEIGSSDIAHELKSVPVFASLPQDFLNSYRLTITPNFISNVRVLGPKDNIDLMKNDSNMVVRARLDFTPKELSDAAIGRTSPKRPTFELPEGVKVDPQQLPSITVEWSVQRREGSN